MKFSDLIHFFESLWARQIFSVELGVWLSAILLLLLGIVLRGWLTRCVLNYLDRLTKRTENTFDDEILVKLRKPLEFLVFLAAVYLAVNLIPLDNETRIFADKILNTLGIFTIFRGFLALVEPIFQLARNYNQYLDRALIGWLTRIVRILLIVLGAAAIGEIWGVPVASIIAGLGLVGAAVALGAQDLFKNLISGIMIIAERRFEVGDWIRVDGVVEGTVESIGFRSSRIARFDLGPVYVPNGHLADNPMVNFSRRDHRRIYMSIALLYSTPVHTLEEIRDKTRAWIEQHPKIVNPDQITTFVNIDSFDDSSIGLMIYCFTTTTHWGEWLAIKEELLFAIKNLVEEAGSGFAFPSRSVYLHSTQESHITPKSLEQQ